MNIMEIQNYRNAKQNMRELSETLEYFVKRAEEREPDWGQQMDEFVQDGRLQQNQATLLSCCKVVSEVLTEIAGNIAIDMGLVDPAELYDEETDDEKASEIVINFLQDKEPRKISNKEAWLIWYCFGTMYRASANVLNKKAQRDKLNEILDRWFND